VNEAASTAAAAAAASPDCSRQCSAALFKDEAAATVAVAKATREMQLKCRCNDGTFQKSTRKICACIGRQKQQQLRTTTTTENNNNNYY